MILLARAVVLATGGCGRVYQYTTNPSVATGDGFAMAARRGVPLWDMEFIQFHPTALAHDDDPMVLISEAVRGEGARLVNDMGEYFMARAHPQADLAPRDVVARTIFMQMSQGRKVFLDTSRIGTRFPQRFPTIHQACLDRGIDPVRDPIPVAPAAHFIMGGIKTDTAGRTALPGLYACGEVACTGVHGANRLASNSLLEGLVFSERIAQSLGQELSEPYPSKAATAPFIDEVKSLPSPASPEVIAPLDRRLRQLMWQRAGIVRNAPGLQKAAEELKEIDKLTPAGAWTLRNMVTTSRLIVAAATERKESRGGHFREDFPTERAEWRGRRIIL